MTDIGGELVTARSWAFWGVVAVCLDARAVMPEPRIVITNSRVANGAGPRCFRAEPWSYVSALSQPPKSGVSGA